MFISKFDLNKKIFLITGATSGIGYATVILLNDLGCEIYAVGRNQQKLSELEKIGNGKITTIKVDLMQDHSVSEIVKQIDRKIDGFVHSAGVFKSVPLNFINQEFLESERKLNYDVFLFLIKSLVKSKKVAKKSSIVAISSIAAHYGAYGHSVYSGTKGALISTIRVLAKELSSQGIRLNSISPGMVRTEMATLISNDLTTENLLIDEKKYPLGYGEPNDVAYSVAFLLSEASSWMTGQDIILDGGRTCYI
jgi:NAD(P)-dependent dehydrogenase (short-subunit alcohol dehydrogenase family)